MLKYYKILHIPTGLYLHNVMELDRSIYRYLDRYPAVYSKKYLKNTFLNKHIFSVIEDRRHHPYHRTAMDRIEFELMEVKKCEIYDLC